MILLAVIAMLPPHSVEVITNLSTPPIYESSSLEESSDEEILQAIRSKKVTDLDKIVKKVFSSESKVDKRLTGLIRRGNSTAEN